jgi:hypothetical protein
VINEDLVINKNFYKSKDMKLILESLHKTCVNNHFYQIINFGIFTKNFFQTICNQNFSQKKFFVKETNKAIELFF